ncbi:hypothetical protein PIB30_016531 [Stylosanthes scabra]|uniref:Transposase (Putative), gypsy type n=1 Tax=Stylosanthes scabra TaxID=79078 RepID=A0ABU6Q7Y4_9FABA|nr:hypothetical protein [Stylosanthes scabra]
MYWIVAGSSPPVTIAYLLLLFCSVLAVIVLLHRPLFSTSYHSRRLRVLVAVSFSVAVFNLLFFYCNVGIFEASMVDSTLEKSWWECRRSFRVLTFAVSSPVICLFKIRGTRKMGKKKSCQNVKVPRPLSVAEQELYGWVKEVIFTQPSVVLGDSLPELRRTMRLTEEAAVEGDFVLEAAGPSDRLPFQADEDGPHFLWVYQELFTRLGVRLPFTDFQREVMTRCRVAVSQLHLNGWGLLRTFEKVCLHFGFRPTSRLFLYIYDILIPPTGYVLTAPGRRTFWLDDGGKPIPWVYWNRGVKDFVIHELDPLETAIFEFLVSLSAGLPKRNNLTCRWILDNNEAVVGKYLDDLLLVEMKKTKLDRMMEIMADSSRMVPRSVLPTGVPAAAAAAASAASAGSSVNPATPSVPVPPPPPAASKAKKSSSKRERPKRVDVEVEEAAKEDPDADLRQKRHLAFPKEFNYRKALDAGLTSASVWKPLQGMLLPDQFIGEPSRLQCRALACQQVGLEAALKAKTKTEEELLAVKDQLSVLKVEHKSALERIAQLEEDVKILKAQLEPAQLSVTNDQKRAEAAESSVRSLTVSLETAQAELKKSREEADYWCTEWKSLGTEAQEMCQETLEIILDQVSHLCPGVDFSAITLKTRWDPKRKRIHVPGECLGDCAEVAEALPEVVPEQQQEQGDALAGASGECPT